MITRPHPPSWSSLSHLSFKLPFHKPIYLPFPSSQACPLYLGHLFAPPVIISCNRYKWGPSPIILLHHLFFKTHLVSSLREQSVVPLIPENLLESPEPSVPQQPSSSVLLLVWLAASHFQCVVPAGSWASSTLSTLCFACFLCSLTCSGGGSSFVNIL